MMYLLQDNVPIRVMKDSPVTSMITYVRHVRLKGYRIGDRRHEGIDIRR